jgi:YD repeat-containing protein
MKNILGTTKDLNLFDKAGKRVYEFYKESNGYSTEYTYDSNGKTLTFKDSRGFSSEYTRDSNGNELTYKDSNGVTRGFNIPEYTMEELVEKLGNFKIKK